MAPSVVAATVVSVLDEPLVGELTALMIIQVEQMKTMPAVSSTAYLS